MDSSRFDAWTRRTIGLAMGGGVASLLGLNALHDADAKKKRKKKRCQKLKQGCQPGGKKKCCQGLTCGESVAIPEGTHCCHKAQGVCEDASECCSPSLCDEGHCCILEGQGPCTEDADCCDDGFCNDLTAKCAGL